MAFIYDLTDTWNAGGVTFNAIKMNVTDTASAAGSKLVTLQVGGAERFTVDKAGIGTFASVVRAAGGSTTAPTFSFGSDTNTGMWSPSSDAIAFSTAGSERVRVTSTGDVGIGTNSPTNSIPMTILANSGNAIAQNIRGRSDGIGVLLFSDNSDVENGRLDFRNNFAEIKQARNAPLVFSTNNTERARIDASGNVGIGTSSPASDARLTLDNGGTGDVGIMFRRSGSGQLDTAISNTASAITFRTGNDSATIAGITERMRIDSSGNLLVGTTSTDAAITGIQIRPTNIAATASGAVFFARRTGSDGALCEFRRDATLVGSISVTTTATTYNTSSDYRLKDIDGPIQNSGAYIDALKPVQGSWKADGSRFIGLLAHEVQEVSETQIATGEKDGEEMQAMDYSSPEIIANVIAEIQALRARVAQLEGN